MGTFSLCVRAVAPLVVFMFLGCVLRWTGLVSEQGFADLRRLAVTVFIPFTNFQSIHKADFFAIFPGRAILVGSLLAVGLFAAVSLAVPRLVGKGAAPTVVHGMMHPNMSVIGIPLARQLLGEEGLSEFVVLLSFLCIVFSALMVANHQYYAGERRSVLRLAADILKTPILVGAALGMVFSLLPFRFPEIAEDLFSTFGGACGPMCLIALGGSFSFAGMKWKPVALTCAVRLALVPAVVLAAAAAAGLPGEYVLLLMLIFACPAALLCQMMSEQISGDPELGAQIVVYTSVLCPFTIFGWLYVTLRLFGV